MYISRIVRSRTVIISLLILISSLVLSWHLYSYDRYDVVYTNKIAFVNEGSNVERIGFYRIKNDTILRGVVLDKDSFNKILIGKPVSHYGINTTAITIGVMGPILALLVFGIGFSEEPSETRT